MIDFVWRELHLGGCGVAMPSSAASIPTIPLVDATREDEDVRPEGSGSGLPARGLAGALALAWLWALAGALCPLLSYAEPFPRPSCQEPQPAPAVQTAVLPDGLLSPSTARKRLAAGALVLLDLRSGREFSAGHLPGASSVPLEGLGARLGALDKGVAVLVYDLKSARSREATAKLKAAGFRVYELAGGLSAWAREGLPVEVR